MPTARQLIPRALRLINEPGRGGVLQSEDLEDGLEALQEILDGGAVSKQFVPGISRHFFPLVSGQSIYSYGAGAGLDFRSDDFGSLVSALGDPAPIKIEDAYIRAGSSITDNEVIDEFRFEATGAWSVDANADIVDNQYKVETPAAATSTTQALTNGATSLVAGGIYRLRVDAVITAGDFNIELRDSAAAFQTFTIDSSGFYDFDFTWPTIVAPDINITTDLTTDDIRINSISLIAQSKRERLELPDARGSDYFVRVSDQKHYNRQHSKGIGGRAQNLLYSRAAEQLGELRLDYAALQGDILVMDVLVNRTRVNSLDDELRLNPQGLKWLRYALADSLAGEYGKSLSRRQITIMEEAWTALASSNRRVNNLRVDKGLRQRRRGFNIDRGDP